MPRIKFSEQWDKLKQAKFKTGELFTTFRGYNAQKDKWYKENRGEIYEVDLKGKTIGTARLVSIEYTWSYCLTDYAVQIDTYDHWTEEDFKGFLNKMYGSKDVFLIKLTFQIEEVIKI